MQDAITHFHADTAITQLSQDRFGRYPFATHIAATLAKRTDPSSLVIGIYGVWGDGKTSVLNFVRDALATYPLVTCITFNPWRFGSEEALLQAFFNLLAQALQAKLTTRSEDLGKLLKAYSGVLKLAPTGIAEAAQVVGEAMSGSSLEVLRTRISQLLLESKVRVVVLIDDIDRMDKSEIQSIFRLVKLTADFDNTSYILAFDEEMVAKAVGERFSSIQSEVLDAGRSFLEKIVQVPLSLPAVRKGKLRQFCLEMLAASLDDFRVELSQEEASELVYLFDQGISQRLRTPRMAARYVNSVRFAVGLLQSEVYIPDLVAIEGIKLLFPKLYKRISTDQTIFLNSTANSSFGKQDTGPTVLTKALEDVASEDRQLVSSLLEKLFPRIGSVIYGNDFERAWSRNKRIASEDYFERYFTYTIDETDVADREIDLFLKSLDSGPPLSQQLAELITAENAAILLGKLRNVETSIQGSSAELLIREVVQNGSRYPDPKTFMNVGQPYTQAAILVSNLFKQVERSRRLPLALSLAEETLELAFLAECFKWTYAGKRSDNGDPTLSPEEQSEMRTKLATQVQAAAKSADPVDWPFEDAKASKLLFAWSWGLGKDSVAMFLNTVLESNPERVFSLLRSVLGTAYSGSTGLPFEPQFDRSSYDTLAMIADINEVSAVVRRLIGKEEVPVDSWDQRPDTNSQIGARFLRIYDFVCSGDDSSGS